jgi:hypothetical protein
MTFHRSRSLLLAALFLLMGGSAWPENPSLLVPENLSSTKIVEQMQSHNRARDEELKHYQSVRHYQVGYRGFTARLAASMDVAVNYDAKSGKSFRILKESGSKSLCEKVLKRAVDSEREAQKDKRSTALTTENYRFHLTGSESLAGRPAYILTVEPLVKSKFLYRGKIWVDATDFALVKIEAEPAKNPSFWISRTLIHQTYAKDGDFWLPKQNRSESKVRIGGTAILTIDYGPYQFAPDAAH